MRRFRKIAFGIGALLGGAAAWRTAVPAGGPIAASKPPAG